MANNIHRVCDALKFIDPFDRDNWVTMGMAIKSEVGEAGFEIWDAWSRQADSYNSNDARDVWKSIRAEGKVTAGTLFFKAKANGWCDKALPGLPTNEELEKRKFITANTALVEEVEIAREKAETAIKAAAVLKAATEAKADHPYLLRKQVKPVSTLR